MQREVRLWFGQTGSGKTFSAAAFFKTCPRAIVAECDYGEFPAVRFNGFPEMVLHLERIGAFQDPHVPFRVSYTPHPEEYPLIFATALEVKHCWLFLEELDRFGDPKDLWEYNEVISRGRHEGIHLGGLSLNPFNCPIDLRRQATSIISFRQTEPSDIKWLADKIGDVAYELPDLPGPGLKQKPPFPYLEWDGFNGARIVGAKISKNTVSKSLKIDPGAIIPEPPMADPAEKSNQKVP